MNWFLTKKSSTELKNSLLAEFPQLADLWISEGDSIEIMGLEVKKEHRNQGIGSQVIKKIKEYAQSVNKPIVLRPKADSGKKSALDRFYKRHGFVNNKGKNKDYELSSPFSKTMYWKTTKEAQTENLNTITVYHGSGKANLITIEAFTPRYTGGLGHGVYVATDPKTALFYGNNLYKLQTKFGWDQVLKVGEDNYSPIESEDSILMGESVSPFLFRIKSKIYAIVTDSGWTTDEQDELAKKYKAEAIALDEIGEKAEEAGFKAVYVIGIRGHTSANEEMLVFDNDDLFLIGKEL